MRWRRILQRLEARLGGNTLAPDATNARLQAGQGVPPPPSGALFISWRLGFADAGIHPRWLVSERSAVSAAELVARNRAARAGESTTRRGLLAFGDDGTGAPFCILADGEPGILFWDPVLDEATYLAHDLLSFWEAWTAGSLPPH